MSPVPEDYDQTLVSVSLSPGLQLRSRYRLERELGRGGLGVVWLATDTELTDRPVAVKLLPTVLSRDRRAIARLKKEALASIELSHPHIVRLINFEVDPALNDLAFLVMQYIDGQTLNDLLADHPDGLPLERVQRWGTQIAAAIDHAHERGVLHLDIKPSNIIIDGDDNAYLMDFGIARETRDTMTRVTGRESSGTLPYMSPQQVDGENHPSNDIYSFAATLYEALCGDPPFTTGDIYRQIKNVQPKPIDGLPEHVNRALLSGLAKDQPTRPHSAAALQKLIEAPPVAQPPPPASPPRRTPSDDEIEELLARDDARSNSAVSSPT